MNARMKLNSGYVQGHFLFAAFAGWLTSSWLVFLIFLLVAIGFALHAGDIRLEPSGGRSTNRRR